MKPRPRSRRIHVQQPSQEDLAYLSVAELAPLLRAKKLSPVELTRIYLERIARINPRLNAYLTVLEEEALREARQAERELARGKWRGPLHGVPIAVKDNIESKGVRTTAGSKILASYVPAQDAPVLARLRAAGAILLGKTHLHEFAYGVTSENVHYGPARNPHDPGRIPGGSSGGSAIAVAAGLCSAAVGTDTGGSIRIPAALCGATGFKPAFGLLPMEGIVPLCRSLDHVGPITRSVEDAAILYRAMLGGMSNLVGTRPPIKKHNGPRRKVRVGWPRHYFFERLSHEVSQALEAARQLLRARGVEFVEVSLSHLEAANHASLPVALAEAYQCHRQAGYFPSRAKDYSEDVRARLERGEAISAADYLDGQAAFRRSKEEFLDCGERVDALLVPTVPIAAPRVGESTISLEGTQEEVRGALLRLCRPANIWGAPAISIPCGATASGLPIGMQWIGFEGRESVLFDLARVFETATEWHRRRPRL